jgi:hypothetical protein
VIKGVRKMNEPKLFPKVVLTIVILLLLSGCATTLEESSTVQPTEIPTPTVQPTKTQIPTFEVMFDGNECTDTLPAQLPKGYYSIVFTNNSDIKGEAWLVYLEDGKTFQDLLDMQSEPGEWDPKPSWAYYAGRGSVKSEESNGKEVVFTKWSLDIAAEYIIFCYIPSPQMIYYAGPVMVVESSSE